eukprot:tig00021428_g21181.t1
MAVRDGLLPLTRFIITHCVVDPTTYLVARDGGRMTSVAGICEYISRTEGPDASAAVAADSRTAAGRDHRRLRPQCRLFSYKPAASGDLHPRHRPQGPLSLGASQPALQAIQFFEPADPETALPVKPRTGQGKRARNSAPPSSRPAPSSPPPPSSTPASSASTRCCRARARRSPAAASAAARDGGAAQRLRQLGSRSPRLARARLGRLQQRRPSPSLLLATAARPALRRAVPPGAVLSAIQGFGAQQEAERQALAARQAREAEERRQALWAQRLQRTLAFRAELEAGFRARQISGAEASETWRAFEAETAGLAKTLAQPTGAWPSAVLRAAGDAGGLAGGDRRGGGAGGARGGRGQRALPAPPPLRPRGGALAATLTWLLGGTPTASAVIGVGFGYAAKTLYAPGSVSMATAGMRPAGR